ncbi:MAG: HlyD family type I secretion periplasmic adaptor subunit [Magnetospiraceae bacterium]
MTALDETLDRIPKPGSRHWVRILMGFIAVLLVWANFADLEEVVIASGEVVPQGKVRSIQHLEGGIIREIFVSEGDRVSAGAPLLRLDQIATEASREELSARLDALILRRDRLRAEADEAPPQFNDEAAARRPEFLKAEQDRFDARTRELASVLETLQEKVTQKELELAQTATQLDTAKRDLDIGTEELKVSTSLLRDKLTPRVDHLRLQREVQQMEGDVAELLSALPRAEAAVKEAEELLSVETLRLRREAGGELANAEAEIAQVREALNRATDRSLRTVINSPIDGVVKSLRYHTIGGVARAGEPIMEIVPVGETLLVEARLSPIDVGYVRPEQEALVKVATYDYIRYGGLAGKVIAISPDTYEDENGAPYFKLRVETDRSYLGDAEGELPITTGMLVTVDVTTGHKTVMQYMISPLLRLRYEAFRER